MQENPVADARSRGDKAALSYDALAAIVDAVDDAIISHALDGTIVGWSAGAERMLGYTAEEAIASDNLFASNFGQPTVFMNPRRAMLGARLNLGR